MWWTHYETRTLEWANVRLTAPPRCPTSPKTHAFDVHSRFHIYMVCICSKQHQTTRLSFLKGSGFCWTKSPGSKLAYLWTTRGSWMSHQSWPPHIPRRHLDELPSHLQHAPARPRNRRTQCSHYIPRPRVLLYTLSPPINGLLQPRILCTHDKPSPMFCLFIFSEY